MASARAQSACRPIAVGYDLSGWHFDLAETTATEMANLFAQWAANGSDASQVIARPTIWWTNGDRLEVWPRPEAGIELMVDWDGEEMPQRPIQAPEGH